MKQEAKVLVGIILFFVVETVIALVVINCAGKVPPSKSELSKESISQLNDTIKLLKEDIIKYQKEIDRIYLERVSIKKEVQAIIRNNEKVDSALADGDWDGNISFITKFLSEESSLGEGHSSCTLKETDDNSE